MARSKKNKKAAAAPSKRGASARRGRGWLADCTRTHIATVADPIGMPAGACACMGVCLPSQKLKSVMRGTFQSGSTTGFVFFNPFALCTSNTASLYYTDSAYTGSTFVTSGVGVTSTPNASNPYTLTQLDGSATNGSMRVVCAALRIRCIDTLAVAKGRQLAYTHPYHLTLGALTFDTLTNRPGISIQACSALEPSETRWVPVDMDEYDYGASTAATSATMGAIVSGAATGTSFEYELAVHYEVVGPIASQLVSPSVMDQIGGGALSDVMMGHPEILQSDSLPAAAIEVAVENHIARNTSLPLPGLVQAKQVADVAVQLPRGKDVGTHLAEAFHTLVDYGTGRSELKRGYSPADSADRHAQNRSWMFDAALRHGPRLVQLLGGLI